MIHTTMLTRRRFLSSGVAIGGDGAIRPLASALVISYSHRVWDASNTPEKALDPTIEDGSREHVQSSSLTVGAAVGVKQKIIILALLFSTFSMLAQVSQKQEPYLDPHLPLEQRVDDLVSCMTLPEKVSQMQNKAPAIPRLHIS